MFYVFTAIGIAIVVFIWWRYTSVARGMKQRDLRLLAALHPIEERLQRKESVSTEEIADLARPPQYRPMLYTMLKHYERLELFPVEYLSQAAQGEGLLVYWMMHPNELGDAPGEIQLIEEVPREDGTDRFKFFVYRYRMPTGHWAEKGGWRLGLAGPFFENDVPYSGVATAFSRAFDTEGKITPGDLVDWFLGMVLKKSS
jgi:hypothetical protein